MAENKSKDKEEEKIEIKILNDEVENLSDLSANAEFNIIVLGKEGKSSHKIILI